MLNINFRKVYRSIFFLACLSFVSWQCYLLFEKFLQKPRSTAVEVDDAKNWPNPKLLFCPAVNVFTLKQCNLTV